MLFRVAISLFNCSCGSSGQGKGLGSGTKDSVRLVVVVVAPVFHWVYWFLSGVWRRGGGDGFPVSGMLREQPVSYPF